MSQPSSLRLPSGLSPACRAVVCNVAGLPRASRHTRYTFVSTPAFSCGVDQTKAKGGPNSMIFVFALKLLIFLKCSYIFACGILFRNAKLWAAISIIVISAPDTRAHRRRPEGAALARTNSQDTRHAPCSPVPGRGQRKCAGRGERINGLRRPGGMMPPGPPHRAGPGWCGQRPRPGLPATMRAGFRAETLESPARGWPI